MTEIAAHHEVHATQVTAWKTQVLEKLAGIFGGTVVADDGKEQIRELREKVGPLTMENSFLEEALGKFPPRLAIRQALDYQTPDERYYGCAALKRAA